MWLIAAVHDSFATQAPCTLVSDLGTEERAKPQIKALDLLTDPPYEHHLYQQLEWDASERELIILWVTGWGICNFRGPWHPATAPPHCDKPAEVVWAPYENTPWWRETTGAESVGTLCGDYTCRFSSLHCSPDRHKWLENRQIHIFSHFCITSFQGQPENIQHYWFSTVEAAPSKKSTCHLSQNY